MPRFDPLFGLVSFEKAAKFIAIFDLVLCSLYILSHFAGGGYIYEERSEEYEGELSRAVTEKEDVQASGSTPTPNETPKPSGSMSYKDFKKLMGIGVPSADILIVLLLCFVIFAIAHICMEVWMCRLLLKAASHKDGSALKTWFWCRLGVTVMFTLYSIVGIMSVRSDIVDWIFEAMNIYRIYTLYIVYEFKSYVSACVNVVKPMEM